MEETRVVCGQAALGDRRSQALGVVSVPDFQSFQDRLQQYAQPLACLLTRRIIQRFLQIGEQQVFCI